jgi:hypothetical protein
MFWNLWWYYSRPLIKTQLIHRIFFFSYRAHFGFLGPGQCLPDCFDRSAVHVGLFKTSVMIWHFVLPPVIHDWIKIMWIIVVMTIFLERICQFHILCPQTFWSRQRLHDRIALIPDIDVRRFECGDARNSEGPKAVGSKMTVTLLRGLSKKS